MKIIFNKKNICLTVMAVLLVMAVSVQSALAYFTTYTVAEGKEKLTLGFTETIVEETIDVNGNKTVVIKNTGSADCYVRVRAIAGLQYQDKISDTEPEGVDNWTAKTGDFYEYKAVLKAGESTTALNINVSIPGLALGADTPDFNVIVIQECAPVLYDENGNTYADWDGSDFDIEKK